MRHHNLQQAADYLDCRINAYRWREDWAIELLGQAPEIIFVDQDEQDFKSPRAFDVAYRRTLKNFKERLHGSHPTVAHSGNGYHFIQPVEGLVLERESIFVELCEDPSNRFHRFAERFLTNNKSDPAHNPTFLSCMLRVPGSINSENMAEVRIIQKWNGIRPAINWILLYFRRYLIQERFEEASRFRQLRKFHSNGINHTNKINWIETLLHVSIADYRKNAIRLILVPYLINIKRLSYNGTFNTVTDAAIE